MTLARAPAETSDALKAPATAALLDMAAVLGQLQTWGRELGFSQIEVADIDLASAEPGLLAWLAAGFHGTMDYMARHGLARARPAELVPGTVRVVTARMDYLPHATPPPQSAESSAAGSATRAAAHPAAKPLAPAVSATVRPLPGHTVAPSDEDWRTQELARQAQPDAAAVSVYARGRDYHKVMRQRLATLAQRLSTLAVPFGHRVFCDSAPVLEVELAQRSGQGWRGKHTLLLSREAGSTFFLGEIYVSLPLPVSAPTSAHCGECTACLAACPTGAIVAPYRLDARRCISYLTIELDGPIPLEFRAAIGNRIYGCDDCQLACPWNKFAQRASLPDFDVRHGLDAVDLLGLWAWDEPAFLHRTEGSAIRRIGYRRWRRNLAVGMGNALRHADLPPATRAAMAQALQAALQPDDGWVTEHIHWALAQNAG